MTLTTLASASRTRVQLCRSSPWRPPSTAANYSASPSIACSSRPRCQRQQQQRQQPAACVINRRGCATLSDNRNIAVVGGGLTGLTTAYYLAKQLPSTAKITLYEGSDSLGGWIRTDRVPVDVDGVKGTVSFERGPRTLSSLHTSTWRFDDLILYDLVSKQDFSSSSSSSPSSSSSSSSSVSR